MTEVEKLGGNRRRGEERRMREGMRGRVRVEVGGRVTVGLRRAAGWAQLPSHHLLCRTWSNLHITHI